MTRRPRASDFVRLQLRNPILAATRRGMKLVQRRVELSPDHAAFLQGERRIVHDGAGDQFHQIRKNLGEAGTSRFFRSADGPSAHSVKPWFIRILGGIGGWSFWFNPSARGRAVRAPSHPEFSSPPNLFHAHPQGHEVARIAAAGAEPANRPFQIPHLGQLRAESTTEELSMKVCTAS